MSVAPLGAVVRIFYDGLEVLIGEALRTPTGRTYVVVERRVQAHGKHVGRQHLACLVVKEPPPEMKVRRLHWYKRARARSLPSSPATATLSSRPLDDQASTARRP